MWQDMLSLVVVLFECNSCSVAGKLKVTNFIFCLMQQLHCYVAIAIPELLS